MARLEPNSACLAAPNALTEYLQPTNNVVLISLFTMSIRPDRTSKSFSKALADLVQRSAASRYLNFQYDLVFHRLMSKQSF